MHVKRWVLAQPDHVERGQIHRPKGPENGRVTLNTLHGHVMPARGDPPFFKGQLIRAVVKQFVPARLRLFREAETAVCIDVDTCNRVHLKGDLHGRLSGNLRFRWRSCGRGAMILACATAQGATAVHSPPAKKFSCTWIAPVASTSATSKREGVNTPCGNVPKNCSAAVKRRWACAADRCNNA